MLSRRLELLWRNVKSRAISCPAIFVRPTVGKELRMRAAAGVATRSVLPQELREDSYFTGLHPSDVTMGVFYDDVKMVGASTKISLARNEDKEAKGIGNERFRGAPSEFWLFFDSSSSSSLARAESLASLSLSVL
mmetsp:Transcript_7538/g.9378  ORF Transcript_7538/g.9378 Transcript_7538/m.9378 type:complete len:135 (+) Transcript_7538:205-609(+)